MGPRRIAPLSDVTHRPLPLDDPSIDALPDDQRRAVGEAWRSRIDGELRAIPAFTVMVEALVELGAEEDLVALARRAILDEQRHVELCRRLAARYLGAEVAIPDAPARPLRIPVFRGATDATRRALQIVSLSLNETTSSVFIEACLAGATAPLARAALRELLTDEIDHARLGWALLASSRLGAAVRRDLARSVTALLETNFATWHRPHRESAPFLVAHGVPATDVSNAAALAATRDLLVPGFAAAGFATDAAQTWLATLAAAPGP